VASRGCFGHLNFSWFSLVHHCPRWLRSLKKLQPHSALDAGTGGFGSARNRISPATPCGWPREIARYLREDSLSRRKLKLNLLVPPARLLEPSVAGRVARPFLSVDAPNLVFLRYGSHGAQTYARESPPSCPADLPDRTVRHRPAPTAVPWRKPVENRARSRVSHLQPAGLPGCGRETCVLSPLPLSPNRVKDVPGGAP